MRYTGVAVRQMIGTFILGVVAILVSIFAVALHWPWPWWAWLSVLTPCVIGGILMMWRSQKSHKLRPSGSERNIATASGNRSIALNNNSGIVSTGDDTTVEL
jgi:hypothetical protein